VSIQQSVALEVLILMELSFYSSGPELKRQATLDNWILDRSHLISYNYSQKIAIIFSFNK